MVKIAIAGGSGNVAQEITDVLVATKKHEILLLSRKDAPASSTTQDVTWVKANYEDPEQLAKILQGVHTVLSFAMNQDDPTSPVQKNLIDASIKAGVKRSSLEYLNWYAYKAETRRYLEEINKDKKILEYTLFQPGILMNYLTSPYKSTNHVHMLELPFDYNKCRALVLDGSDDGRISLTTMQDLANVVTKAVEFEGEWPVIGGITGTKMSIGQLIALGEKVRGVPFKVEKLKAEELEDGTWKSSWAPKVDHPSIPPEQVEKLSRMFLADYEFTQAESFLSEAWRGKPL